MVFLDEPTTGLDPQSRAHMWDEIRRLRAEGMTVFITTHYLDEADALCDRIAIMDHGQIVAEGTPAELKREISGDVVLVGIDGSTPRAAEVLDTEPFVTKLETPDDGGLRLYVDDGATAIPQILRTLDSVGITLRLDRAAPAQPRRRVPHQDRPLAARILSPSRIPRPPRNWRLSMKLARDTWLIFQRQVLLLLRNPVWIFVGIFQPVMYLLLFAPLLKPALAPLGATTDAETYRIFVPGLLVLLAIFGGLFQGFGLIAELRAGVIERSRVTPVSRLALLLGRSLRDVVSLLMQAVIITLLALAFGLRVQIGYLLLAYLLLALIALMTSALSYGIALVVKSEDALAPLMNTVAQPVLLLSGILLPLAFAPLWLRRVADWNPFAWAVDGARALFAGEIGNDVVWQGMSIMAVITALAVFWAARKFATSVR